MRRHNLGTVVGFELRRVLRRRWFWLASLGVPLLIAAVLALSVTSNQRLEEDVTGPPETFAFTFTDASGLVDDDVAAAFGGTRATDDDAAVAAVRAGQVEAHVAIPADPTVTAVQVDAVDAGLLTNDRYAAVARGLLQTAAQERIGSPELVALARGDVAVTARTYDDAGHVTPGFEAAVLPLSFLVVFFLSVIMLGNQMLTSTLEEKENRVTEMILTTMNPTTLIVGKIVSVFVLGLVQLVVLLLPAVVAYVFFRESLDIPDLDLSGLVVDPVRLGVAFGLFAGGFVLFTGSLVAIGASVPTVKEAGNWFAPLSILVFLPLYVVGLVVSEPDSVVVQVFTYFPYTAPSTALLRNGLGTLSAWEAAIVVVELFVLGALALRLAVRLFRYGSIEYSTRLPVRAVLRRRG
nr:ABC transporter permease [uncultured Actinotalea sp.]